MSYLQPAFDLAKRSATTGTLPPPSKPAVEVAKLIDVSKCIGCKACQVACSEYNDLRQDIEENVGDYTNPHDLTPNTWTLMRFAEWENPEKGGELEWLIRKDGCMHCEDPGCLKACPSPGAIVKYTNGIVDFISENCIGCGYCVNGCPFNIPRISDVSHKASKCTLCSDRVANGSGPACAKACPTKAITFGAKVDMKKLADERIMNLKGRGYSKAGLYDPAGVKGTHVMYLLPHADKAPLYAGLPQNPTISPLVEIWKGTAKYAGMALVGLTAVFGLVHHVLTGANRVSHEDEENAAKLKGGRT